MTLLLSAQVRHGPAVQRSESGWLLYAQNEWISPESQMALMNAWADLLYDVCLLCCICLFEYTYIFRYLYMFTLYIYIYFFFAHILCIIYNIRHID